MDDFLYCQDVIYAMMPEILLFLVSILNFLGTQSGFKCYGHGNRSYSKCEL